MGNRVSDEEARNRWLVISALRVAGVAMVLVGLLLTIGGPFEKWCHRQLGGAKTPGPEQ